MAQRAHRDPSAPWDGPTSGPAAGPTSGPAAGPTSGPGRPAPVAGLGEGAGDGVWERLLAAAPDALVVVDESGRIVWASERVRDVFGHAPEDLRGRPLDVLVRERLRAAHAGHLRAYLDAPRARPMGADLSLSGLRADGSEVPVEISLSPLRTGRGLWVCAAVRDVTGRRRAEEELRRREAQLADTQAVARMGSWEWDMAADRVSWSAELDRIFGLRPGEAVASYAAFMERVHPDDRARLEESMREAFARESPLAVEHRIVRSDGTERILLGRAELVTDPTGVPLRVVGTAQDITDQRRAERALYDSQRRAHEESLRAAREHAEREAAERESRRLKEFLAIAGHELRTPLSALMLDVGALARDARAQAAADPRRRARIEKIERMVDRLARLLDNLLEVSRVTGGRVRLACERFDLREAAREVADRFAAEAARAGRAIALADGGCAVGSWDRLRVEQALANLVSNALRHAPGGPVEIEVGAAAGHALLRVRDHGPGVPSEAAARIFEPFERADQARRPGGMGLGLYVTRQIAEAHGGSVRVEPASGGGAVFTVELPFASPEGGPEEAGARQGGAAEARPPEASP